MKKKHKIRNHEIRAAKLHGKYMEHKTHVTQNHTHTQTDKKKCHDYYKAERNVNNDSNSKQLTNGTNST